MLNTRTRLALAVLGVVVLPGPLAAVAQDSYSIQDIHGMGTRSEVRDMCPAIGAAGDWVTEEGDVRAFLWTGLGWREMVGLGGPTTRTWGMNEAIQVVGRSTAPDGSPRAFLYNNDGKPMQDLTAMSGGLVDLAADINNMGEVAAKTAGDAGFRAVVLNHKGALLLDCGLLPGGTYSFPMSLNLAREVAGYADFNGKTRPFVYRNGAMHDLGLLPGFTNGKALDIARFGQVVGVAYGDGPGAGNRGFLAANGVLTELLPLPGYANSVAVRINEEGNAVGWVSNKSYLEGNDAERAVLWRAGESEPIDLNDIIPSDSGWVLLAAGGISTGGFIGGHGIIGGQVHAYAIRPVYPCWPDLTGDGALNIFDFLEFINRFAAGDLSVDCNKDAALDLFDFLCFIGQFNNGC